MSNTNYLSVRDAAAKLSIGVSTLNKLRIYGGGPVFNRIGRRVVYSSDILNEWASRESFETTRTGVYQTNRTSDRLCAG